MFTIFKGHWSQTILNLGHFYVHQISFIQLNTWIRLSILFYSSPLKLTTFLNHDTKIYSQYGDGVQGPGKDIFVVWG